MNFDGDICEYKFNGTINNNLINGTYEYLDDCDVESGTISLKIINDNFYLVKKYFKLNF